MKKILFLFGLTCMTYGLWAQGGPSITIDNSMPGTTVHSVNDNNLDPGFECDCASVTPQMANDGWFWFRSASHCGYNADSSGCDGECIYIKPKVECKEDGTGAYCGCYVYTHILIQINRDSIFEKKFDGKIHQIPKAQCKNVMNIRTVNGANIVTRGVPYHKKLGADTLKQSCVEHDPYGMYYCQCPELTAQEEMDGWVSGYNNPLSCFQRPDSGGCGGTCTYYKMGDQEDCLAGGLSNEYCGCYSTVYAWDGVSNTLGTPIFSGFIANFHEPNCKDDTITTPQGNKTIRVADKFYKNPFTIVDTMYKDCESFYVAKTIEEDLPEVDELSNIRAYPNPVHLGNTVAVDWNVNTDHMVIIDYMGKTVGEYNVEDGKAEVNVNPDKFTSGIYLLYGVNTRGKLTGEIIKLSILE